VVDEVLSRILLRFPQNYSFVFAYGSGIFHQAGKFNKKPMLDLIFAVENPTEWHKHNLQLNRRHYSLVRLGGATLISKVQEDLGAGVYYNTLVPFEKQLVKYGVISTSKLIVDLLDWETLYVSGRLHKPVLVLKDAEKTSLKSALRVNLQNALHAVLLQLPEMFSEQDLYLHLAGLSYTGDFRMTFGEDRNKVFNIVVPQMDRFRLLYGPHVRSMKEVLYWDESSQILEQDCSYRARLHHLNLLPKQLQHRLVTKWNRDGRMRDVEEILNSTAADVDCAEMISAGIEQIVRKSSWSQTFKGVLTAGVMKSIRYGSKKLIKMLRSLRR